MNKNDEKIVFELLESLSDVSEYKNELYYILIPIVFSKKFFKSGLEIKKFVEDVMGLHYAEYAFKSRTILIGKIMKSLNGLSVEESVKLNERIVKSIKEISTANQRQNKDEDNKKSKTNKNNSFFSSWNDLINNKNE